ncbi:peptidoglycan-binding protein [Streptomyces xinghaiensis]
MTAPDGTQERERDEGADRPGPSGDPSAALELRTPGEVADRPAAGASTRETPGDPELRGTARNLETREKPAETAAGSGDDGEAAAPPASHRRSRTLRTSMIVAAAITVVAAAGAATTGALGGDGAGEANAAPSAPPKTAEIRRTTLTRTETVDGNLGYGEASAVQAPAGAGSGQPAQNGTGGDGGSAGIITWVPEDGDVIKRGGTVYRADEEKIPLLYGSTPFYRTLGPGSEGGDVKILEKNLSELGYTGFTADDAYTETTAAAVRDWQDDLGREETGRVGPGDAVVAPGARRVADVKTSPGALLNGTVLTWTGTERIVTVDLDVRYEDLVEKGTKATVTLPDDSTVRAEVTDVGTLSGSGEAGDAGSGGPGNGGGGNEDPTLPVELEIGEQKGLGRYQAAGVEVTLKAETRENVLAVPVNALVAERGGGYAVEVVDADGTVERRAVKLGMFADSMVEVSGKGITEGLVVGVPK